MARSLVGLLLVVACTAPHGARQAASTRPAEPPKASAPASPQRAPARVAPHGSEIQALAVTEAGDAVVSCDAHDACRLWPRLDGTSEPVVIDDPPSGSLAIARVETGLVVAMLDAAGGLAVLRFTSDGHELGRAAILPAAGLVEAHLIGDTVLALAGDQRVMLYSSELVARGAIAAPASERIATLTVRRGRVTAALIRHGQTRIDRIRTLDVPRLAWHAPIDLPEALESIAMSPSGERLAGVRDGYAVLVALTPKPALHQRAQLRRMSDGRERLGLDFLNDGLVIAFPTSTIMEWNQPPPDPWTHDPSLEIEDVPAIANDLVVSASGGSLVLSSYMSTRYLGYRHTVPTARMQAAGSRVAVISGGDLLQLTDRLQPARYDELYGLHGNLVAAIDERRVVYALKHGQDQRFEILDLETGRRGERDLGTFKITATPYYEPVTRVFAMREAQITLRYRLDRATLDVTPLRSIATPAFGELWLLDPRTAGGAIAVTTEPASRGGLTIEVHYEDAAPRRVTAAGTPIGTDRAGVTHVIDGTGWAIRYQHGKSLGGYQIKQPKNPLAIGLAPTGEIVARTDRAIVMLGKDGAERWRATVWNPIDSTLTTDATTLVVATPGGMLAFDAATGARVATACGWSFGLHESRPQAPGHAQSVCTD